MFKSMTGYGRGETVAKPYGRFFAEIQSVNRKYSDININLPKQLSALEPEIRNIIQSNISRGKINVYIGLPKDMYSARKLSMNKDIVKQYIHIIKNLKKEFKIKGDIDLNILTNIKDAFSYEEPDVSADKLWAEVKKALEKALKDFDKMRAEEGRNMSRQIDESMREIKIGLKKIEEVVPVLTDSFKQRIKERINELNLDIKDDDERVQKEIAILAERADVTEELSRMYSHIGQFEGLQKKAEPVGRTLDFLMQEMMREANTMGSKAVHKDISPHIVGIKSELEKIREQVQNVE